jgi:hypothetical protein
MAPASPPRKKIALLLSRTYTFARPTPTPCNDPILQRGVRDMKSRIKILSGIFTLSLIFIPGIETNAQGISKAVELKKNGWVRAAYFLKKI